MFTETSKQFIEFEIKIDFSHNTTKSEEKICEEKICRKKCRPGSQKPEENQMQNRTYS